MRLPKTAYGTCITLVLLYFTIWMTWNYYPIKQTYVRKGVALQDSRNTSNYAKNNSKEMRWNYPIKQTLVRKKVVWQDARNSSNYTLKNFKEMTDFYRVPYLNVYINKQPAMHVNTKNMHIISFGFAERKNYKQKLICLQQLNNGKILNSSVNIWELPTTRQVKAFKYHSVFIHCMGLSNTSMPAKVSILPSDKLQVDRYWLDVIDRRNHTIPAKGGIAMCVNSIYNHRSPRAIIEWMEVQRLMKVDKVYLYGYHNVSKNVEKVLKYYQGLGVLKILPFNHNWPQFHETFSGKPEDHEMSRKHYNLDVIEDTHTQFAAYNDCLYRFGSLHKYLAYIDLDEYIVASGQNKIKTYADILSNRESYGTFYFSQVRFCVPGWLHLKGAGSLLPGNNSEDLSTRHVYRTPPMPQLWDQRKVIVEASSIRVFGVHEPFEWWGARKIFTFPLSEAKKHHYTYKVHNLKPGQDKCNIMDGSMLPFQKPLENNLRMVVKNITKTNPDM